MLRRRCLALLASGGVLPLLSSCTAYYGETTTVGSPIYIRSNVPDCPVKDVALAEPTVGLFIGISNYQPGAGVISTPAHFIGASLFAGIFSRAGELTGPSAYADARLTDIIPTSRLPKTSADPSNVVRVMGYGSGGSDALIRRAAILGALATAIADAEKMRQTQGRVRLVIYVAAHGLLGADGRPSFLPGDASVDAPSTWIAYGDVVDAVKAFLAGNAPGEATHSALLIFDTCQNTRGAAPSAPARFAATPGLVLVQSAAPGQYAWHWTASATADQHVEVVKETRLGLGLPPPEARGDIHRELASTMSVLPLANQCAVAARAKALKAQVGGRQVISVQDWFEATKTMADDYLSQIPEMQRLGRTQQVSMVATDADAARPLFIVGGPGT